MTASDASSVVLQLRSARDELETLNRTVTHCLLLATERDLLAGSPLGQHARRVPSTWGARRDAFFWDSWDWKLRGEDDLRRFFEIARRIGQQLHGLEDTPAADLLPGTAEEIVGSRTNLFLPDYWLLVVHHLGWTGQLPYECEMNWKEGRTFADARFSVSSRLPVNVVQGSIDALTVLIDATPHCAWDREAGGFVVRQPSFPIGPESADRDGSERAAGAAPSSASSHEPIGMPAVNGNAIAVRRRKGRFVKKRSERATNIEALKKELIEHIKAARDHAQAAVDFGRLPELLPRPSRRELAVRVGITESAASRCFGDPAARELNVLWDAAEDLESVLKFVRN